MSDTNAIPWKSDSAIVPSEAVEDMRKLNHNWNSVPLIRCRDCKYLSKEPVHEYSWGDKDYWCSNHDNYVWLNEGEQPDGFCSWAERSNVD